MLKRVLYFRFSSSIEQRKQFFNCKAYNLGGVCTSALGKTFCLVLEDFFPFVASMALGALLVPSHVALVVSGEQSGQGYKPGSPRQKLHRSSFFKTGLRSNIDLLTTHSLKALLGNIAQGEAECYICHKTFIKSCILSYKQSGSVISVLSRLTVVSRAAK